MSVRVYLFLSEGKRRLILIMEFLIEIKYKLSNKTCDLILAQLYLPRQLPRRFHRGKPVGMDLRDEQMSVIRKYFQKRT